MSTAKQTKKSEQYYALQLWDASVPGFCSLDKMYIGTEDDIKAVAKMMAAKERYPDTVKAISDYFEGKTEATHSIAFQEIPILKPVLLKAQRSFTMGKKEWEHLNTWQWPYNMRFDGAELSQIIIKYEKQYYRCLRAKIKNLQYESVNGRYDRLDSHFWGNGFVFEIKHDGVDFTIENLLYVGEIAYAKFKDAKADFESDNIKFEGICDEIFGDG